MKQIKIVHFNLGIILKLVAFEEREKKSFHIVRLKDWI
jgi:hypothetical protein